MCSQLGTTRTMAQTMAHTMTETMAVAAGRGRKKDATRRRRCRRQRSALSAQPPNAAPWHPPFTTLHSIQHSFDNDLFNGYSSQRPRGSIVHIRYAHRNALKWASHRGCRRLERLLALCCRRCFCITPGWTLELRYPRPGALN